MKKNLLALGACCAAGAGGLPALAGPYIDDLGKCIIEQTTVEDRAAVVRWMFAAATLHPAVKALASIPAERLDAENKATAGLFMRLLTESCRDQTQKAIQYEGPMAIAAGFQVLGQVAGRELFSSPEVSAGLAGMEKYMDNEKLKAVTGNAMKSEPASAPAAVPAPAPAPR
ncbi:MAG: hypothetical protein AB7P31_14775 [Steroidobacteraceae bacterium]